jgi:hypothetical protein
MDIATIESEMLELMDFEEVRDVGRARRFITAANRWLALTPSSSSSNSQSMSVDKSAVQDLVRRAHSYITANQSASSRTRFLHVGSLFR